MTDDNATALQPDEVFTAAVRLELEAARQKFPSPNLSFAALVEEVGELANAMLKVRAGLMPATVVWLEAVQVATMAQRVAVEGDPSFTAVAYEEPG